MILYVDIETTGFSPRRDAITRISALKVHKGVVLDVYDQLIDPERPIPPTVQKLTGLTNELCELFPLLADVQEDFIELAKSCTLVGYGDFENKWLPVHGLAAKCFSCLQGVKKRVQVDRVVSPMPDFKLETVAARLGIPHRPHDSLSDATAMYNVCTVLQVSPF